MGCSPSRDAVEATQVVQLLPNEEDARPAPDQQQHIKQAGSKVFRTSGSGRGSFKDAASAKHKQSFSRNQVVPLPDACPQATESGRPQHDEVQPLLVAAKEDSACKHSQPMLVPPQDDFSAVLSRFCNEKVTGSNLTSLAEQLHSEMKMHLAAFLRAYSTPSSAAKPVARCAADAATACNAVLLPVLAHINRTLSSKQATSTMSEETTSWEQMEFGDFLGLLEASCNAVYDLGVMEVGRPVSLLLDVLYQLCKHAETKSIPCHPSAFKVASVSELLSMLGIIFFRRVVLETQESAAARLDEYQQLREQMGWADEHLAVACHPAAGAMLLYLQQVAAGGERRVNLVVRRQAVFWDALAAAEQQQLLPPPAGVTCCKMFPSFVDGYSQGAGSKKPAVEAGEGHGPRKEFFSLAGQDMGGQPPASSSSSGAGAGAQEPAQHPQHPALFVYRRSAGAYWFNTQLQQSAALTTAYTFAGWCAGQCILNRAPLGLGLPAVLFQLLLQGDAFKPSLASLQEFDPEAANGVRNVASLPPEQLQGMLDLEGLPLTLTAEQYISHAARQVLQEEVKWQAEALAAGFFSCLDRRALRAWAMDAHALAALVSGTSIDGSGSSADDVDVQALFRVVLDEELSGHSSVLVQLLWDVLSTWPAERRLRFVEFVTGTSRLPLPGSELLKIQAPFVAMGATEHSAMLGMLPQAHTCDNLLELPNYWESLLAVRGVRGGPAAVTRGSAALTEGQLDELKLEARRVLSERLELAVLNFEGYGLDARGGAGRDDDDDDLPTHRTPVPVHSSQPPEVASRVGSITTLSASALASLSASMAQLPDIGSPRRGAVGAAAAPPPPPLQQSNEDRAAAALRRLDESFKQGDTHANHRRATGSSSGRDSDVFAPQHGSNNHTVPVAESVSRVVPDPAEPASRSGTSIGPGAVGGAVDLDACVPFSIPSTPVPAASVATGASPRASEGGDSVARVPHWRAQDEAGLLVSNSTRTLLDNPETLMPFLKRGASHPPPPPAAPQVRLAAAPPAAPAGAAAAADPTTPRLTLKPPLSPSLAPGDELPTPTMRAPRLPNAGRAALGPPPLSAAPTCAGEIGREMSGVSGISRLAPPSAVGGASAWSLGGLSSLDLEHAATAAHAGA